MRVEREGGWKGTGGGTSSATFSALAVATIPRAFRWRSASSLNSSRETDSRISAYTEVERARAEAEAKAKAEAEVHC